jgi:hypothetical protein
VTTLTLAPLALDRSCDEPTLDDLLMDVWEGLSVHRAVRCPVCVGMMEPVESSAPTLAGRCRDCGATLR